MSCPCLTHLCIPTTSKHSLECGLSSGQEARFPRSRGSCLRGGLKGQQMIRSSLSKGIIHLPCIRRTTLLQSCGLSLASLLYTCEGSFGLQQAGKSRERTAVRCDRTRVNPYICCIRIFRFWGVYIRRVFGPKISENALRPRYFGALYPQCRYNIVTRGLGSVSVVW